jgi:putative heme transporter
VAGMFTGLGILAAFIAIMASERAAQAIGRWLDKLLGPLLRKRRAAKAKAEAEAGRVKPPMSIEELVTDLRARINDVVGSGWISMTLGMVGFFGAYYVLFVLIMRGTGVTLSLNLLFAAFAIGRLLTAVGITPGGMGITETATSAVLVGWGAESAGATAGVVLFSIFTHLMEVPLGALGWLLWTASTKVEPPAEGDEPAFVQVTG